MKLKVAWAVGVFASCLAIPPVFAQDGCTHPRAISVIGNAEIKVAPDEVLITLGVDSHDRDLAVAKADNDTRMKKLLALAHAAGVSAANIQTSALTMGPEYSDEKIPKLLSYRVSETVTITLKDLTKYEDLMTNALRAGVNRVDGVYFLVADPKKHRDEARLAALRAAREKASSMAAELGQKLGKPWEISEEPEEGIEDTTLNMDLRPRQIVSESMGQQSTVAGGEIVIQAIVRVSFLLE
ncbi:MAG TPA: SIMPL domain-containing protein [Candidatus Acidoferrales bacterium]|nr:SIMPL domain-containing protein [Candidatus Acidoferrales bacterium]